MKNMRFSASALQAILWVETGLVVLAVALWLLGRGFLAAIPLALLWLVLLVHLGYDGWRVYREGTNHLTRRGRAHAGFRALETLGIVVAPFVLTIVASAVSEGPDARGLAAIGGLYVVMGVLAAIGGVVVVHAVWLLFESRIEHQS